MIVNYCKMTGEEFKKICAIIKVDLGLDQKEIAAKLGIGKTKLHENLNRGRQIIDKDVENSLLMEPQFSAKRTLFAIQDKSSEQLTDSDGSKFHPGPEIMAKALEMINETLLMIKDDNQHIKKTSDFFQAILEKEFKEGNLVLLRGKK